MRLILTSALALLMVACTTQPPQMSADEKQQLEETLLKDYLDRINSNDLDTLLAGVTDDVVYQAPHGPEVIGKVAVGEWVKGYFDAFHTKWEKTALDFMVSGDIAVERYAYKSTDTDKASGEVFHDVGKGLNVYRKGKDGQWWVARDAWSTDLPAPAGDLQGEAAKALIEQVYADFANGDTDAFKAVMATDIVWNEAEGNPYADKNPYVGPNAVFSGMFARQGQEWAGFSAKPLEYVVQGNRVIAFGRYHGTFKATGKVLDAPFVHAWTIKDGKITAFQQYTNTAAQVAARTK